MKPLVTVIMSVYNETVEELSASINSIINQTYKNIEIIIVLDNPSNLILKNLLLQFCKENSRLIVVFNEKNLGLPNSLNKCIKYAKGEYIARMDADDISFINRLEKQVAYIERNNYIDILGCKRIDIDEKGVELNDGNVSILNPKDIAKILPYGSVITHPSVLIKKKILLKLEGYRSFEASQDYDLWLRALTSNYHISILDETLLYYRIRRSSISNSNPFKQYLFNQYAKNLYRQRLKHINDDFSKENLERYLKDKGFFNEKRVKKFNLSYNLLMSGINNIQSKKLFLGLRKIVLSFIKDREMLQVFKNAVLFKIKVKSIIS